MLSKKGALQELGRLPPNNALEQISDALGHAAEQQGTEGGVVMMVVSPGERNAYDQQV